MTTPLNHDEAHDLRNMVQEVLNERDRLREEVRWWKGDHARLTNVRDDLKEECSRLFTENERLKAERDALYRHYVLWGTLPPRTDAALKIGEGLTDEALRLEAMARPAESGEEPK